LALVLGVAKPEAGGQAPAASAATGPTVTVAGARLDWAKGHLVATGAAAAALRAPGPDVARVGAERAARTRALATLSRAVLAVPVASGGTVQDLVGQDPAKARRLTAAVERARTIDTSYASDGSAQVVVALPLEGVRLALWPAPTPTADPQAPTVIVVDAQALKLRVGVGLELGAGAAAARLPTLFVFSPEAATADARAGGRVLTAKAKSAAGGRLELDLAEAALEQATRAGALVMIVVRGST
jgi:hypothetical protein